MSPSQMPVLLQAVKTKALSGSPGAIINFPGHILIRLLKFCSSDSVD